MDRVVLHDFKLNIGLITLQSCLQIRALKEIIYMVVLNRKKFLDCSSITERNEDRKYWGQGNMSCGINGPPSRTESDLYVS